MDRSRPENEQNIGHVRIGNGYVVGPGSTHPNGQLYLVARNLPIAHVTEAQVREALAPWIIQREKQAEQEYARSSGFGDLDFPILSILDTAGLRRTGDRYQGPHPVHGSTTGTNFHVDLRQNAWYCFRCDKGGRALHLLAVQERIISCSDLPLQGDDFKKAKALAIERGLIEGKKPSKPKPKTDKPAEEKGPVEYPWLPVTETIPCLDAGALFFSLVEWLKRYIDFRVSAYYHVVAAWIMATWVYEKARVTGPLYLLGPVNSGKTTVIEVLEQVAYKGIRGGSMSNATMFRLSHALGPSFLVDEAQVYNREEWAEQQAFLNERYRKGGKVWRMVGEDKEMVPKFFNAYGPTALASSNQPWPALVSRSLTLHMGKNTKDVEQTLTPRFEAEGQHFRNQLQGYREAVLERPTETFPELEQVKDYRTREIGHDLLAATPPGEARGTVLGYLKDLEGEHQAEEETGEEADYVAALCQCTPQGTPPKVTAKEVRDKLAEVLGEVEIRVRTGVLGEEPERRVNENAVPRPRQILGVLVRLGFKKKARIGPKSIAGILWDQPLLDQLKQRYRVGVSQETPENPRTPETSVI